MNITEVLCSQLFYPELQCVDPGNNQTLSICIHNHHHHDSSDWSLHQDNIPELSLDRDRRSWRRIVDNLDNIPTQDSILHHENHEPGVKSWRNNIQTQCFYSLLQEPMIDNVPRK